MSSFDIYYNYLNSYYDENEHSLLEIFDDFKERYNIEYKNSQDDCDFKNWLDFVTPIYKKFYWDRINSLKKDGELYNAIELLRRLNHSCLLNSYKKTQGKCSKLIAKFRAP